MTIDAIKNTQHAVIHVNHASLLIKNFDHYLLCDPWYISPAFSNWTQNPPPPYDLIKFILDLDPEKISVVASHGHDDHIDDWFVRHHLSKSKFYVPTFKSPGLKNRVKKLISSDPIMLTEEPCPGIFRLSRHINGDYTSFDSIIIVETDSFTVVHANDNWHALPEEIIVELSAAKSRAKGPFYYFSQIGIADCFPHCYPQFGNQEIIEISRQRIGNNITSTEKNMTALGIKVLYCYANQSKILSEYNKSSFNGQDAVERCISEKVNPIKKITQVYPGYWFDLSEEAGHPNKLELKNPDFIRYCVKKFEQAASEYIKDTLKPGPLRFEIADEFDVDVRDPCVIYATSRITWQRILMGLANLETISIGGGGLIFRYPKDCSIRDVHIALGNFGYIAQNRFQESGLSWLL